MGRTLSPYQRKLRRLLVACSRPNLRLLASSGSGNHCKISALERTEGEEISAV